MILTEYDYDTDIAVQREEAYEEGAKQKAVETAKNLLSENLPIEQVARCTGLSIEQVEQLAKQLR